MTAYYSAAELAKLNLPGLPGTERGVHIRADRESWPSRPREKKRGGGVEYPVTALPQESREALLARALRASDGRESTGTEVAVPVKAPAPSLDSLKSWQTTVMEARAVLLAEIDRQVLLRGVSRRQAIDALVAAAREGTLREDLARRVPMANARAGKAGERTLCLRSVYNWLSEREKGTAALAPKAAPEAGIPDWASAFMTLYSRPTQPGMAEVLDDKGWPTEVTKPSYDQARRFVKRLDAITRNMGRMGPRALKALRAYHARDVSELWPGAVFIGDGHTFKREVAHPVSGRPMRPEVTVILDIFTRKWVGWSLDLAENTWAVADALRHAMTGATCPDILYYDNGSGANNKTWDDAVTGLCARLGITKVNSVPWSSQSRGVVERFHSSVLHKLARNSLAYVGPRMDKEARQKAYKISRKDIKETGSSPLLLPWSDFIQELNAAQADYNARPHSSLEKTIDPATGKRRHMSPGEVWDQAIQGGWQADPIPVEDARHLFRPAVRRKVARGLVSWIGNAYFAPELEALHGEFVMVSYDIHDAASVTVSLLDGRFVCEAQWDAHKTSYFPVSMVEKAQQNRLAGKLNRLDQHRDTVLAEAGPGIIEHQPAANDVTPDMQAIADAELARMEALALPQPAVINANGRPKFGDDLSWAAWLADHPDEVDEEDRTMVRKKARTNEFRLLCEMHGINLAGLTRAVA